MFVPPVLCVYVASKEALPSPQWILCFFLSFYCFFLFIFFLLYIGCRKRNNKKISLSAGRRQARNGAIVVQIGLESRAGAFAIGELLKGTRAHERVDVGFVSDVTLRRLELHSLVRRPTGSRRRSARTRAKRKFFGFLKATLASRDAPTGERRQFNQLVRC